MLASLLAFVAVMLWVMRRRSARLGEPFPWLYYIFFVSGIPALIYQIVWERALFAAYGVNIESVTVVVTGFMLGLGLGSLFGGRISRIPRAPLLAIFAAVELSTALFGMFSLALFHWVALYTAGASLAQTAVLSFALLLIPTMLMGSTLPLLVAHLVRRSHNVGPAVGILYFSNTLGSAVACFLAADLTMGTLGQSGSVILGAALNIITGLGALTLYILQRSQPPGAAISEVPPPPAERKGQYTLAFPLAVAVVALTGFVALGYEIIWYRLLSFQSGGDARSFPHLLGAYLFGIALGGLVAHDVTSRWRQSDEGTGYLRLIAWFVVLANLIGFLVGPAMAMGAQYDLAVFALPIVVAAAAMLAAAFPLVCHISLAKDARVGWGLGLLYFANIVGSALGSLLVGFVLMDIWGVRDLCLFLALLGISLGLALFVASGVPRRTLVAGLTGVGILCAAIVILGGPLFSRLYEKLQFKEAFRQQDRFRYIAENRSGVITVTQDGTVFGGGIYDGAFNVDLVNDRNHVYRIYFLNALHPAPRDVLMIGLSSGSWAQIVAHNPDVQSETIVEINPGYLSLIPKYPDVASLLRNPKVQIIIDDGRRWLLANPARRFDAIVMNTTFSWREHTSNLLSVEFLTLARRHLRPGGVLYYNTTGSEDVLLTGVTVFPYALRVGNFLALSDNPIEPDAQRLGRALLAYRIDGHAVLDPRVAADAQEFQAMLALTRRVAVTDALIPPSIEYADSIRERCRGRRIITDDNMGTEFAR